MVKSTKVAHLWIFAGLISITFGIFSLIWSPGYLVMQERLRMRPGLPPFDWWYDPPKIYKTNVYLFNITNAERYLSGEDSNLIVEEVGPIVFNCLYKYSSVVFNDNGTLSYTLNIINEFNSEVTTVDLNATLIYPNVGLLLTASYFWDANYFFKKVLNYVFDKTKSKPIVEKTVYEILYNNTDKFLQIANTFLPHLAKTSNIGYIPLIFDLKNSRITVKIGTKAGNENFFRIDKYNGSTHLPYRGTSCKDSVVNTTDCQLTQYLDKTKAIRFYTNQMCSTVNFFYQEEVYEQGFKGYKFVLPKSIFNRTQPTEDDCYKGLPTLPDGLLDASPCWFSFPVSVSLTTYAYDNVVIANYNPNHTNHNSYVIAEPTTGVVLRSQLSLQGNIIMRPLRNFHEMLDPFNNIVIPIFYSTAVSIESIICNIHLILNVYCNIGQTVQFGQCYSKRALFNHEYITREIMFTCSIQGNDDLPTYVVVMIQFMIWLSTIGLVISVLLLISGLYCIWNTRKYKHKLMTASSTTKDPVNLPEAQIFLDKLNYDLKK